MILFANVFISEQRLWGNTGTGRCERGLLPDERRLDVFKYCLASMATIDWTHAYIFCGLDKDYADEAEPLRRYVEELFPRVDFTPDRLIQLGDWRRQVDLMTSRHPEDLIWYTGNDDHIFIDSSLDCLNACLQGCQELRPHVPRLALQYSHWDETVRKRSHVYSWEEQYSTTKYPYWDAIMVVSPELMRSWFFRETHHIPDAFQLRRTEDFGYVPRAPFLSVVPHKELVRHFDGYNRFGANSRKAAPMRVPPGFFDNDIKIATYRFDRRSYAELRRDGYIIFDPAAPGYSYNDIDGADFKATLDDIPLFWQGRISEIRKPADYSAERLYPQRCNAVLEMVQQHLPLDLPSAVRLFPPAFATREHPRPSRDLPSATAGAPAVWRGRDRDDLRVYRHSTCANPSLSLVLIDRNQAPDMLFGPVAEQVRFLKSRYDLEFVYALIDDAMGYNPACDWVGPRLDGFVDTAIGCRFEHFFDKLGVLEFALRQCRAPVVLALEWLFACDLLDLVRPTAAVMEQGHGHAGAPASLLTVPTLLAASQAPQLWELPGIASGAAFAADPMRRMLAGRPETLSFDTLGIAANLQAAAGGTLAVRELPGESGMAYRNVRMIHDKLYVWHQGHPEQLRPLRPL